MARLENLKPGVKVKGIVPGQSVSVVDIKWHGSTAVELFYKRTDGQPGTQLLFRNDEPNLEIVEARRAWRFNADGDLFRSRYGISAGDRLVVCVSRIDYQKNQLLLVRAFARFAARHPEWRLVLVGPITAEAYHERIAAAAAESIPDGRFLAIPGFGPDDPLLPAAFRAADIFVLPTRHEPFGIVVLEAWAARAPVVAARVGGIPGFAEDGRDILFFPSENLDAHLPATKATH